MNINNSNNTDFICSPLNYTGGKFKILDQILPHFPKQIDTFVDLFCGGCNVGINVNAQKTVFCDSCNQLINLFSTMRQLSADDFIASVRSLIDKFDLSDSTKNGYSFYGCDSSSGLGSYNKDKFNRLKSYYATLTNEMERSIALYVLIVFGFNNQIRFNSKGFYNLAVGKRDFNAKMELKLRRFINRLNESNYEFIHSDFRHLDISTLGKHDFVYVDPPYLITTASYNENGGWTSTDEHTLLDTLDCIDNQGCRFALSNVTESNGRTNDILINWIESNKTNYRVVEISKNYANSNYHRKDSGDSREVLIVNYDLEVINNEK